jgi:hypothetical protein
MRYGNGVVFMRQRLAKRMHALDVCNEAMPPPSSMRQTV